MNTTTAPTPTTTIDPTRDPQWLREHRESLYRHDLMEALRGEWLVYGEPDYARVGESCEDVPPPPMPAPTAAS